MLKTIILSVPAVMAFSQAVNPGVGLRLSATPKRASVAVGEPLMLKVSTMNVSRRSLFITVTLAEVDHKFEVRDATGAAVPMTDYGRNLLRNAQETRSVMVKLRPGEEHEETIQLEKLFQLNKPGTYQITVKRIVPRTQKGPSSNVEISADTCTVVITEI